ncbi:hypothetical protein GGF46_000973 [Coemansia sp. RSA 552]|nr:hypothetical protein GGF46_000973 [Coemansia sp. RSA 552]
MLTNLASGFARTTAVRSTLRTAAHGAARRAASNKSAAYGEYHFRGSIERGRRPYALRNMLTAAGLAGLCSGIYFYSLYAVKQEDYSDVPMPDMPTDEEKASFYQNSK